MSVEPLYTEVKSLYKEKMLTNNLVIVNFPNGESFKFLIDCGITYKYSLKKSYNYECLFDPKEIDAIFITHDDFDHSGKLLRIVSLGFKGKIYTTYVMKKFLEASIKKIEEKSRLKEYNNIYNGYKTEDVMKLVQIVKINKTNFAIDKADCRVEFTLLDNGHKFGANMIYLKSVYEEERMVSLLFMGDYKMDNPFVCLKDIPLDILNDKLTIVSEATINHDKIKPEFTFKENIKKALNENKDIIICSGGRESAQMALRKIKSLRDEGFIKGKLDVFIDSKYIRCDNNIYSELSSNLKIRMKDFMPVETSYIALDNDRERAVECTNRKIIIVDRGGFSKYAKYLKNNKWIIQFTFIEKDNSELDEILKSIDNEIFYSNEFLMHGDRNALIKFYKRFNNKVGILINHGSNNSKANLKKKIKKELEVPAYIMDPSVSHLVYENNIIEEKQYRFE